MVKNFGVGGVGPSNFGVGLRRFIEEAFYRKNTVSSYINMQAEGLKTH